MMMISKQQKDMQFKSKRRILSIAIICLFCPQLFLKPAAAVDDISDQRKIQAQTGKTLETKPEKPTKDAVLVIPGLPLKLRPGFGCADKADHSLSRRVVATHPFKIEQICFGDTKGPDIKHDFTWFMILDESIKSPQISRQLPPGLVLSLFPKSIFVAESIGWQEATGEGFVDWSLIEKLPKFTMVGLKYRRNPKNKSFKWQEKAYDCADSEIDAPSGFRRAFLYDYCWFEKATGPDILH